MRAEHVVVVGRTMVGGEEEEVVSFAYRGVQRLEKGCQVFVKLHIDVVVLLAAGRKLVADGVGRGNAHREHVGGVALSESLALQCGLGHKEGHGHALRGGLDVVFGRRVVLLVEVGSPFRQRVHIVAACHEMARGLVPPVGSVGRMASGQDGGTVLEGHAHHARLVVVAQAQFVADGRGAHQVGTALASARLLAADGIDRGVLAVLRSFVVDVEPVACNAVDGGHGTGKDARMAQGRDSGGVVDLAVLAGVAFGEQPLEAAFSILVIIVVEVVPAHLVDDEPHDQLGAGDLRLHADRHEKQNEGQKLLHVAKVRKFFQSSFFMG